MSTSHSYLYPLGQEEHAVSPSKLYDPFPHSTGEVDTEMQRFPAGHLRHDSWPVLFWYVPLVQTTGESS